jgi:hypothetical protein
MQDILVPISPGELLDKITILRIKSERMKDEGKLAHVRHELKLLEQTWSAAVPATANVRADEQALADVNTRLWDIEDEIRVLERQQRFDSAFIALARSVYIENDERAAIKKRVNIALGSALIEEKSYQPYR